MKLRKNQYLPTIYATRSISNLTTMVGVPDCEECTHIPILKCAERALTRDAVLDAVNHIVGEVVWIWSPTSFVGSGKTGFVASFNNGEGIEDTTSAHDVVGLDGAATWDAIGKCESDRGCENESEEEHEGEIVGTHLDSKNRSCDALKGAGEAFHEDFDWVCEGNCS